MNSAEKTVNISNTKTKVTKETKLGKIFFIFNIRLNIKIQKSNTLTFIYNFLPKCFLG